VSFEKTCGPKLKTVINGTYQRYSIQFLMERRYACNQPSAAIQLACLADFKKQVLAEAFNNFLQTNSQIQRLQNNVRDK